jgi:glycosyltransferase involved in cell wall biosynthesis
VISSYTNQRLRDVIELLDSIKAQTYPNIETILVIERSNELFANVMAYASKKTIHNVEVIFNHGERGASAARNLGIKQAKGDIVAFVDDDVLLFPEWAQEMVNAYLKDDSIIGVAGSIEPLWDDSSINWFPAELYWIIGCTAWSGWGNGQHVRNGAGANMSFMREGLKQAGGFNTSFGPKRDKQNGRKQGLAEDAELSLRITKKTGKPVVYHQKARAQHKIYNRSQMSLRYIAERSYQVGCSRVMLKELYGQEDKSLLGPEHNLLKRILTRLFPDILENFLSCPAIAWRKFSVTIVALLFVALGYYLYPVFNPSHLSAPS